MAKASLVAVLLVGILLTFVGAALPACAPESDGFRPAVVRIQAPNEKSSGQEDPVYDSDPVGDHPWGGAPPRHGEHPENIDLRRASRSLGFLPVFTVVLLRPYAQNLIR